MNIPPALQGTLITAYAFTVGLFALIMGPVSDRIGRRKILLYGSLAMTVALALHAVATGYTSMLVVRAAAGAAGGVLQFGVAGVHVHGHSMMSLPIIASTKGLSVRSLA